MDAHLSATLNIVRSTLFLPCQGFVLYILSIAPENDNYYADKIFIQIFILNMLHAFATLNSGLAQLNQQSDSWALTISFTVELMHIPVYLVFHAFFQLTQVYEVIWIENNVPKKAYHIAFIFIWTSYVVTAITMPYFRTVILPESVQIEDVEMYITYSELILCETILLLTLYYFYYKWLNEHCMGNDYTSAMKALSFMPLWIVYPVKTTFSYQKWKHSRMCIDIVNIVLSYYPCWILAIYVLYNKRFWQQIKIVYKIHRRFFRRLFACKIQPFAPQSSTSTTWSGYYS